MTSQHLSAYNKENETRGDAGAVFIQTIMEIADRQRYVKKALMELTGISKSTVDKMNRGEYVSMEVIDRICSNLHCDISEVINFMEEQHAL